MKAMWDRRKASDGRALVVHYLSADRAERFHHWWSLVLFVGFFPLFIAFVLGLFLLADDPGDPGLWIFCGMSLAIGAASVFLWTEFHSVSCHEPPRLGARGLWMISVILHVGGGMAVICFAWITGGIIGLAFWTPILILPLLLGACPSILAFRDEWAHDYHRRDFDGSMVWEPMFPKDKENDSPEERFSEDKIRKPQLVPITSPALPPGPPIPKAGQSQD